MAQQKTILVAPLHWGLGHATRCIPIIKALLEQNYKVLLASDGAALLLLKKEFPNLPFVELPSYHIRYPKKGYFFKWLFLLKLPKIKKAIASEKKMIARLVSEGKIQGIISDNRFGVYSEKIPSVFITHQLKVLSGNTSFFSSKLHQKIIKKFDVCWVPDVKDSRNLSGDLGHLKQSSLRVKYIGVLSRMKKRTVPKKYDVLVLLSGPEPQRTLLEQKLTEILKNIPQKVLLVKGVVEDRVRTVQFKNMTVTNFLKTEALEQAINESEVVVARSGYTTIMDLSVLEKKAFFIPTPGQYEQEYLAKRLKDLELAPSCSQKEFTLQKLAEISNYKGLKTFASTTNFKTLFSLFEGEGKL